MPNRKPPDPVQSWSEFEIASLTILARDGAGAAMIAMIIGRDEGDIRRKAKSEGIALAGSEPPVRRSRSRPFARRKPGAGSGVPPQAPGSE